MDTDDSTPSSSAAATAAAASTGSPTFEYHDRFLDKVLSISVKQRHQLDAPLTFVKAWLRFSRGRRAALGTALPQPPPPFDHTQFALWPAQRVRGMPGLTATTCQQLSTAPASLNVYSRVASGWRTLILDRVLSGYIHKIQQTRNGAYTSVIFNGHVYQSLSGHDPHSTKTINEYQKLYYLPPAWHICLPNPDALHVCAAYPWAARALFFANGSAYWTANSLVYRAEFIRKLAGDWVDEIIPGKMAETWGLRKSEKYRNAYGLSPSLPDHAHRPGVPLSVGYLYYDILIYRKL